MVEDAVPVGGASFASGERMPARSAGLRPHRAERVITVGRLLLAVFLVVALALDPTDPARFAAAIQRLSFAYLAYAALVALIAWSRRALPRRLPMLTHVADLLLFSLFMFLSEAPTSPFFVYFIFATICGALRWDGRGALVTGSAALAAYIIITLAAAAMMFAPGEFEENRFITRCTQLLVITLLLAYFGAHQQRLHTEIGELAAWPRRLPAREDDAVRAILEHSAAVLRVRRMVLTWQEGDEPDLRIAVRDGRQVALSRERPDLFDPLVPAALERSSFFSNDASAAKPFVVRRVPGGFDAVRITPLHPSFRERYRVTGVLALRLSTETVEGRLFALARRPFSIDDVLVGDIVGRFVASALEEQALLARLRESAAGDERVRLARELHDGVLQSMTALGLQAERLRSLVASQSPEAERRLTLIQDTLLTQQRTLRELLEALRPGRPTAADVDAAAVFAELAARLAAQWEVQVICDVAPETGRLPERVVHELSRMTEEAVVNAIRHGEARRVRVEVDPVAGAGVRLTVTYRGRGFSTFEGRHDLASLNRMQAGPRTLKERVGGLGGGLVIESGPDGARLEIVVWPGAERPGT